MMPLGTKICRRIADNIAGVIRGQSASIRKMLAGPVAGGHVLLEDFPGTGKTTLAKALALIDGMDYVPPEHVQDIAVDVLAHRLVIDPQARFSGETAVSVVSGLIRETPVP